MFECFLKVVFASSIVLAIVQNTGALRWEHRDLDEAPNGIL